LRSALRRAADAIVMGGGIAGTVTAGERVSSTGPQSRGPVFCVRRVFRSAAALFFCRAVTQLDSFRIAAGVFMARSGCYR
jgi:hypothetical protein